MFELNLNVLAPLVFAVIYGPATYWRGRNLGMPIALAMSTAVTATIGYAVLAIMYGVTLNYLGVRWNSLAGIGAGLLFGLAALAVILAFQRLQRRQRHSS